MKKHVRIWALAILLLLCLGGGLFFYRSGFFSLHDLQAIRDYIDRWRPYSHLAFFFIQFLSVVLAPVPSNISAAAGGLLFGPWMAFFLTFGAVLVGSVLVFCLARVLGRDFVDRLVSRKLSEKYQDLFHRKATMFLLLAFLFPFFPDDVLCILAGLSSIPLGRFVVLLLAARPWGLLVASALGGQRAGVPLLGYGGAGSGRYCAVCPVYAPCRAAGRDRAAQTGPKVK